MLEAAYGLGAEVKIGDDRCITGHVHEIIWRKNCLLPLYQVAYWLNGKLLFEVLPEEVVFPYD